MIVASRVAAQVAVPAVRTSVDSNGVDLFHGSLNYQKTDISIGQGLGSLAFTRSWQTNGWRNSLVGTIQYQGSNIYIVSLGASSDSFLLDISGTFQNLQGNGSTLVWNGSNYTYTTSGGLTVVYAPSNNWTAPYASNEGRLISVTLPGGERTDYNYTDPVVYCTQYDGDECVGIAYIVRLQSVINSNGFMLKLGYKSNNHSNESDLADFFTITSVTSVNLKIDYCDPKADSCTYSRSWPTATYTGPANATDPVGRTWSYSINGSNQLTGIRNPTSGSDDVTITYDGSGRVHTYATTYGTWTYTYSTSGAVQTTTVTDPQSNNSTYTFDIASARMLTAQNALGKTWTYSYDGIGRIGTATAPEGNSTAYHYDSYGNADTITTYPKSGGGSIAAQAVFGNCPGIACSSPTSTTDPKGNTTTFDYWPNGQIKTVTLPCPGTCGDHPQTRYYYTGYQANYKQTSGGSPTPSPYTESLLTKVSTCRTGSGCEGAEAETRVVTAYDASQNNSPYNSATGAGDGSLTATTTFAYDDYGNKASVDGPLPGADDTTLSAFDAAHNLLGSIGPAPGSPGSALHRAVRYGYNGNGWVTSVERGTVSSYSTPLTSMSVLSRATTDYDNLGRTISSTIVDPAPNVGIVLTQYNYDSLGRRVCTAVRMNPATYGSLPDACSLATTGSNGPDRIAKFHYDAAGQTTLVEQALGTADRIDFAQGGYTDNGKLKWLKDANGNTTCYTWDTFDRAESTHYASAAACSSLSGDYEQLGYDGNSNPTSLRLRDGNSVTIEYDSLDRLTRRYGVTVIDRTFQYDNVNHLTYANIAPTGLATTFAYDALGRLRTESSPLGDVKEQYDLAGRRTSIIWPDLFRVDYGRYVTGEILNIQEPGQGTPLPIPITYYYDDLGRLTGETKANGHHQSFGYDSADRLTALSTTLPGGTSTAWPEYTPGSQIFRRSTSDEQMDSNAAYNISRTYEANSLNQYTKAGAVTIEHDALGNTTRLGANTFAYDGDNLITGGSAGTGLIYDALNRLQKVNDDGGTRFAYAGGMIVGEWDNAGNLKRRYVPDDSGNPLIGYEGASIDRRYLAVDERGSITDISNNAGASIAINQYDDWGIPAVGNVGRFGYTGQTWIPQLKAWNYKARVYHPMLGRFLQSDPIGFGGGDPNIYRYVSNDPLDLIDPMGTDGCQDRGDCLLWSCYGTCGSGYGNSPTADNAGASPGSAGSSTSGGPIGGVGKANGGPYDSKLVYASLNGASWQNGGYWQNSDGSYSWIQFQPMPVAGLGASSDAQQYSRNDTDAACFSDPKNCITVNGTPPLELVGWRGKVRDICVAIGLCFGDPNEYNKGDQPFSHPEEPTEMPGSPTKGKDVPGASPPKPRWPNIRIPGVPPFFIIPPNYRCGLPNAPSSCRVASLLDSVLKIFGGRGREKTDEDHGREVRVSG